jgi:hypothetical protein
MGKVTAGCANVVTGSGVAVFFPGVHSWGEPPPRRPELISPLLLSWGKALDPPGSRFARVFVTYESSPLTPNLASPGDVWEFPPRKEGSYEGRTLGSR